jgi:feruloyl esterase
MTSPLKDPKTGRVLFDGHLLPGSELGWGGFGGPEPPADFIGAMRSLVFKHPTWDYHTMDISTDVDRAHNADNGAMYAGNADLRPFFGRGGKLLMYHGWSDARVTPQNSVLYFDTVAKTVGADRAANSIALFMIPGMDHCRGGEGPNVFDAIHALERWVEHGERPTQIIGAHTLNGRVNRTRPLCPYPQVASYKGSGSIDEAANFVCQSP